MGCMGKGLKLQGSGLGVFMNGVTLSRNLGIVGILDDIIERDEIESVS